MWHVWHRAWRRKKFIQSFYSGSRLWDCSSKSNVNIIQRFQSKTLRLIAGAPRYVSNQTLHVDLSITTVEEERHKRVNKRFQRLQEHENQLPINLVDVRNPKRLKRIWPCDLRGEQNLVPLCGIISLDISPSHALNDISLAHRTVNFICIAYNLVLIANKQ